MQTIAHILQKECQRQCQNCRATPDKVLVLLNSNLLESLRRGIVNKVLNAIQGVENKRPGQCHLDSSLDNQWQSCKGGSNRKGLQVPASQGSDQVADAVGVQAAREEHAREALPDGAAEEGLVLVVDLEVWAHRAGAALGGEQSLRVGLAHGLGGGCAADLEGGGRHDGGLDSGGILGQEGRWLRDYLQNWGMN